MKLVVCICIASACVSYNGIKPVYPDAGHPAYHIVEVADLQPTLKWASNPDQTATYDLVIFEGPEAKHNVLFDWEFFEPSNVVYKRTYLLSSEHKVENALKPSHIYFWTIKASNENSVWSSYNYHLFVGIAYYYFPNLPFRFRTPNIVSHEPIETIRSEPIETSISP